MYIRIRNVESFITPSRSSHQKFTNTKGPSIKKKKKKKWFDVNIIKATVNVLMKFDIISKLFNDYLL